MLKSENVSEEVKEVYQEEIEYRINIFWSNLLSHLKYAQRYRTSGIKIWPSSTTLLDQQRHSNTIVWLSWKYRYFRKVLNQRRKIFAIGIAEPFPEMKDEFYEFIGPRKDFCKKCIFDFQCNIAPSSDRPNNNRMQGWILEAQKTKLKCLSTASKNFKKTLNYQKKKLKRLK